MKVSFLIAILGIEVRPRQKLKEKSHKDKDMDISSSHAKPKPAATSSHSGKRRAMNEPIHEGEYHVCSGDNNYGF
jgi:hypothetical protein